MTKSKPFVTPMDKSYTKIPLGDNKPSEDVPYRQEIVYLISLVINTRPDIAFSIGNLSQNNQNPRTYDWVEVKSDFRYINRTHYFGILYGESKALSIDVYSNAY